jgi:hypothetical protein
VDVGAAEEGRGRLYVGDEDEGGEDGDEDVGEDGGGDEVE